MNTQEISIEPVDPQDEGAALYDIALSDISIDRMGYELRDGDDYGWDRFERADQDLVREMEDLTQAEREGLGRAYRAVASRLLDLALGSNLPHAYIKAALNAELDEGERLLGPNHRGAQSRSATTLNRTLPEMVWDTLDAPVSAPSAHASAHDLATLAERLVLLSLDHRDVDRLDFARQMTAVELRQVTGECSSMERKDLVVLVNLLADLAAHLADQWCQTAKNGGLSPDAGDVPRVIRDREGRGWQSAAQHTVTRAHAVPPERGPAWLLDGEEPPF